MRRLQIELGPASAADFTKTKSGKYKQFVEGAVWVFHLLGCVPQCAQFVITQNTITLFACADQIVGLNRSHGFACRPWSSVPKTPVEHPPDKGEIRVRLILGATIDGSANDPLNVIRRNVGDRPGSPFCDKGLVEIVRHHRGGAELLAMDVRDEMFGDRGERILMFAFLFAPSAFFVSGRIDAGCQLPLPGDCLVARGREREGRVRTERSSCWVPVSAIAREQHEGAFTARHDTAAQPGDFGIANVVGCVGALNGVEKAVGEFALCGGSFGHRRLLATPWQQSSVARPLPSVED